MHTVASTPSAGCAALCVRILGGHPPLDRVHAGKSLCTCDVCVLTAAWGVAVCVLIVSFARVYRVGVGLVSLSLHCFLHFSSAWLIVVLIP